MLEAERRRIILDFVRQRSIVRVPELAEILHVSSITVRRDMNVLAAEGLLRRVRGGASALSTAVTATTALFDRREASFLAKRAIARAAVDMMSDGDAVMINGGSTTYAMTEFLHHRSVAILTNSLALTTALLASRNRLVMPGGALYAAERLVLSFDDDSSIVRFPGRTLFTGCFGVNRLGLMEADSLALQAGRQLLRHAERIVALADSSKLRQRSSAVVVPLARVTTLITDSGAAEEDLSVLRSAGVEVICVSASGSKDDATAGDRARDDDEWVAASARERATRHLELNER